MAQLKDMVNDQPTGWTIAINETNIQDVTATLEGPEASPFEGGKFLVKFRFPSDYPNSPPLGRFMTKVFHPNISVDGEICVNVLKRDWTPDTTLRHVLMIIRCLLLEPFPESALNDEAAKLEMEDYEEYVSRARMWTSVHAKEGSKPAQPKKDKKKIRRL
ncbi:Ubiquitin-protein ligase Ube2S [Carpediemonas membranifera]|uniref:Ubiquitin-protein ligase Ube2S n=1 Tax=Carpediemonas membranifera TaxID=201153 RepID=A0A8J6BXA3_9EUKA|nr:Ubiquitin-protein ligase Ube2S [Carpediemonas membranifera]|eukprot:KAG9393261.1 Ubiquitin-protein ligase Ube2S [Carpediemonas membranifera]